jgi:hypothetical protein
MEMGYQRQIPEQHRFCIQKDKALESIEDPLEQNLLVKFI